MKEASYSLNAYITIKLKNNKRRKEINKIMKKVIIINK